MPTVDEYDQFVVTLSPRLLRSAYLLTRDWAAAEDLLQTALAKAWFAWRRLDEWPEAYVRKIMFHTYASWWRRGSFAESPTAGLDPQQRATDHHAEVDDRDQVWRALGRLPRRQRAVLVLRYYEDLSVADIAVILDISEGTVKSQTARALARLRRSADLTPGFDIDKVMA
jgi:RNA polymerase sigma-70 factor (sigma-E family)